MRTKTLLLLTHLFCFLMLGFSQDIKVSGDNSPAVIAQNFSVVYDVRADAIMAILKVYEKEGLTPDDRKRSTETLLKKYSQSAEKKQATAQLSDDSKNKLGLTNSPALSDALNWDLFARKNYLSTAGANSPAVVAGGDVHIWYGIPPKALRSLAERLEADISAITDFEKRLREQVKKYEELEKSLVSREDEMAKEAKRLLDEGNIEEAVKVLKDRRYAMQKKRERAEKDEAASAFDYAQGLVLEMKYDSAAIQYKDAVDLDPQNSQYIKAYASNEYTRAHYDEAIEYYQKALAIDTVAFKNEPEKAAFLYSNLGLAWQEKGEYDRAIEFHEKALAIDSIAFGNKHPDVAVDFNNLGGVWQEKGEYDRAIAFFEKALAIDSAALGNNHSTVAREFNNLGLAWHAKGKYDRAIEFYEKALAIDSIAFGNKHPTVALRFNNLGGVWHDKSEYDRAIALYEKALAIDSIAFGNNHPNVARVLNNLGAAWQAKGEHDRAIVLFEKALAIDSIAFGNNHPAVGREFNNLGSVWLQKGEYDRAIACFEKALFISILFFEEKHPSVAILYNNLGFVWQAKGEYDHAITYYEKALPILWKELGANHPYIKIVTKSTSKAANDRGMELFREKKYAEALPYFEKGIGSAEQSEDWGLSIICLNNLGNAQKQLGHYAEGLATLEKGITQAQVQDQKSGKSEFTAIIRRMQYHLAGCFDGLGKRKKSKKIYQQLKKEALETNDTRLMEDLKNDGWIKK